MMMRFYLLRCLKILLSIICLLLLLINLKSLSIYRKKITKNNEDFLGTKINKTQATLTVKRIFRNKEEKITIKPKPWFMNGGTLRPVPANKKQETLGNKSYSSKNLDTDRIVEQLMYIPPGYNESNNIYKKILFYYGEKEFKIDSKYFNNSNCPVKKCITTSNLTDATDADAILFRNRYKKIFTKRPMNQIWIFYALECPIFTAKSMIVNNNVFNWTATYRADSDIVAPYAKWVYYDEKIKELTQKENYAANKTKQVVWFVSNCRANLRLYYAKELQKYIQVDIYGLCGTLTCSKYNQEKCFQIIQKDYKFYLSFENANCKEYITEKFFTNALTNNVLPIVMGARPQDYEKRAPYRSYIHVDEFNSPKELAQYLHHLDKNDDLYNSYFKWKGTGEFINTHFFCRLCAMLHKPITEPKYYSNIKKWWNADDCSKLSWRKRNIYSNRTK